MTDRLVPPVATAASLLRLGHRSGRPGPSVARLRIVQKPFGRPTVGVGTPVRDLAGQSRLTGRGILDEY
jgi:hypothetical protein